MVSGKPGSNIYSVPPMIWCLVSNAPKKSTVKIVWNKSNPDATHEKISELSSHKPIPISTFPRSQKKRKFCAPYCRQYTGAQTSSQTVHTILSHSGTRKRMARYCMRRRAGYYPIPRTVVSGGVFHPRVPHFSHCLRE